MYWWNVSKLADDLREGRVGEKERFKYCLATFIALILLTNLYFYYSGEYGTDQLTNMVLSLIFIIMGITLCYRVNKSGDNIDFVGRMICLGWPYCIRILILWTAIILPFAYLHSIETSAAGTEPSPSTAVGFGSFGKALVWSTIFLVYFWSIAGKLSYIAHTKEMAKSFQEKKTEWSLGKVAVGVVGGVGIVIIIYQLIVKVPFYFGSGVLAELIMDLPLLLIWLLLFHTFFFELLRSTPARSRGSTEKQTKQA